MNSEGNNHMKSQEGCIRCDGVFVSKCFTEICASMPSHTNNGKVSDSDLPIPLLEKMSHLSDEARGVGD